MKTQKLNFTNLKNSKVVSNIFKSVLGLSLIATFTSCMSDSDIEDTKPQPDGVALNNMFQDNRINGLEECCNRWYNYRIGRYKCNFSTKFFWNKRSTCYWKRCYTIN